jgi:hypothetical protein
MPLTPEQRKKLHDREQLDNETRKANEYRVRKYAKTWIESLEDMLLVLKILPERQVVRLFNEEDVIRLLEITERMLVYLDFMPIRRYENGDLFAEKSLLGMPENGSPCAFSISRPATDLDLERYTELQKHIARLETFVRPSPGTIYNDLDRVYFRDLIKIVKKKGYEPTETSETEGVRYIPRLTEEQRQFRKQQSVLIGLGFKIHSPEDLEALKEKNRSERLQEEEELRALGVPSDDELAKAIRSDPSKIICRKPEEKEEDGDGRIRKRKQEAHQIAPSLL